MKKSHILVCATLIPAAFVHIWLNGQGVTRSPAGSMTASITPTKSPREERSIQGIGFVEPVTEVRKLVFKVNGVIARCPAEIGRFYKAGDVLMELDGREQLAAVALAEADWKLSLSEGDKILIGINPHQIEAASHKVEVLKEQVRYWEREHDRAKTLLTRSSMSPAEYDKTLTERTQRRSELQQAKSDLRNLQHFVREEDQRLAEAKVVLAKAKLDLARQQHEDTILHAPFDGTVLELLKREGEGSRLFDPEPIVMFGDTSRLRVRAEFDERFVAGMRIGQRTTVFGRGLGAGEYPGRVVLIKPIMGKKTVFSRSSTERKDLDVLQIIIEMEPNFCAPVGLEVDVKLFPANS
jgi:HlyD family secretion protein